MKLPLQVWLLLPAICAAQQSRSPLSLSLRRAVEIATSPEGSTRVQLSSELARQAEARAGQARAALLPNVDAQVAYQSQTRNLEALGLRSNDLPIPGFRFPTFVGPFNVLDVRANATQNIFEMSSIRRYQAARAGVSAAKADQGATEDQIAALVAKGYVAALRANADLDAAKANVELADALLKQAENLKAAGTGTGIDVTRARVQASNERQRLLVAENERRRTYLQLLRTMNLRLDTEIELTDRLEFKPPDPALLERAEAKALESRADLKAQTQREENARLSSSASRLERLPSVAAFADYGTIGPGAGNLLPTRTVGVAVRVPVFDGGRRDARRAEAASQRRHERIRTDDLREQIALEVRLAIDSLRSAEQEVQVATEGLSLAENELAQARRRFDAGFAGSIEVTDAQTRLARARDNQTIALFHHASARVDLLQSTGTLRGDLL